MDRNNRGYRTIAIIALCLSVLCLSVGFAAFTQSLAITGTGEFNPGTWDIKFKNLSAPVTTSGVTVVLAPTLNGTSTAIGSFDVSLTEPGDSIIYTFDIANDGNVNAVLGTFTKAASPTCTGTGTTAVADASIVCSNIIYTLTYTTGGAPVNTGDTLSAGDTKNVTLKLEYPTGATLPEAKVEITDLGITLLYKQY